MPFIIFAILESLALILVFLSPRKPFDIVFAPPIRAFWGERFLHYPANFLLLSRLAGISRMFLAVIYSSLLTGAAVSMVSSYYTKKQAKLKDAFILALKKYASLFIIVLLFILIYYFSIKAINSGALKYFAKHQGRLLFLSPKLWISVILPVFNFIFAILIQSIFTYAIPALIRDKVNLFKALAKSLRVFGRYFLQTIVLVGLPLLIYIPILILNYNTAFLINRLFPEFILIVLFSGIIVSSLIIDPLITVSTAVFYLLSKEQK